MRSTAASAGACQAMCGRSRIWIARFSTPRGSRSPIQGTSGGWSSRASCRRICSACWTSCASRSTPNCTSHNANAREDIVPIVYKGRVFAIEVEKRAFPNGRKHQVEIVRHRPSVVLIPIEDDGRVVLVRQYRAPIDRMTWEFPAGRLDEGESAEGAA